MVPNTPPNTFPAPLSGSAPVADWLIDPSRFVARIESVDDGVALDNGLARRTIRLSPGAATIDIEVKTTGVSLLRAVEPEAQVTLDGVGYDIGGLLGQPDRAFLRPEWVTALKSDPKAFRLTKWHGDRLENLPPRVNWDRSVGDAGDAHWPNEGALVALTFAPPPGAPHVEIVIHHALHNGLPLLETWMTIRNPGAKAVRVDSFTSVRLAFVEPESIVDKTERWLYPNVTVTTDYSFGGMASASSSGAARWVADPHYDTQVNYERQTPCLLTVAPPLGPAVDLGPGETLTTFRTFLLLHDDSRERKGLAVRRMYRTLAPWCRDNPLLLHVTSVDDTVVKTAIDQCANVGFEMVILSFGSGLNMEDTSDTNIAKFKALADYAHEKKIRLGGYSLLASRRISDEHDVINAQTGKTGGAIFGDSPCLCSRWGIEYFEKIQTFLSRTGFDVLEHDGSYPGDVCASTAHPGHRELNDSQWRQYEKIAALYAWCRARGVFLNVPDWYFLAGSNKTAMGYRETNWSLPRAEQVIHGRQNLFDGTWEKAPSMGWMFVPLVVYQGGGAAATIEPLKEHLPDYERHLQNNLGFGAQACYRGPRLYDAPETRLLVKKWVDWFKSHRQILESDIIHLRRADGRDLDGVIHVNPRLSERALAVIYNPTDTAVEREIRLPLYYAGLTNSAKVSIDGNRARRIDLSAECVARVKMRIAAQSMAWASFSAA